MFDSVSAKNSPDFVTEVKKYGDKGRIYGKGGGKGGVVFSPEFSGKVPGLIYKSWKVARAGGGGGGDYNLLAAPLSPDQICPLP